MIKEATGTKKKLDGPLAREREMIQSIRRVFLLLAGGVYLKYGLKLEREQESIMKLADIAIYLYAAESAVLRTLKAIKKNGLPKEQLKESLAVCFVDEVLLNVESLARQLMGGIGIDAEKTAELIRKELAQYPMQLTFEKKREIAARYIEAEKYIS